MAITAKVCGSWYAEGEANVLWMSEGLEVPFLNLVIDFIFCCM